MKPTNQLEKLYARVAAKILSESLNVAKGESVTIETWNNGQDLAQKLVMESRKIGAIPIVLLEDEEAYVSGAKFLPQEMRGRMGKNEHALLSATDAYVFIPGFPLSTYYYRLTSEERAPLTAYNNDWYEAAEKARLRGVRFSLGYTTKELARMLKKREADINAHQLKAFLDADLTAIKNTGKEITKLMQNGVPCSITSPRGHTLNFRLGSETALEDGVIDADDISSGNNMTYIPPGLASNDLDSSTVSGEVEVSTTSTHFGPIKDATLEFESGKLVKWKSKSSERVLNQLVRSIGEDSCKLSRIVVGLNPRAKLGYGIDRFVSGAITLNVTIRMAVQVPKGTLTINGKQVVIRGKLAQI